MDLSFCCLKDKEVINIADGKKLGRIIDMCLCCEGRIISIMVPGDKCFFKNITQEPLIILWKQIIKIGEDTILVDLCNQCSVDNKNNDKMPKK